MKPIFNIIIFLIVGLSAYCQDPPENFICRIRVKVSADACGSCNHRPIKDVYYGNPDETRIEDIITSWNYSPYNVWQSIAAIIPEGSERIIRWHDNVKDNWITWSFFPDLTKTQPCNFHSSKGTLIWYSAWLNAEVETYDAVKIHSVECEGQTAYNQCIKNPNSNITFNLTADHPYSYSTLYIKAYDDKGVLIKSVYAGNYATSKTFKFSDFGLQNYWGKMVAFEVTTEISYEKLAKRTTGYVFVKPFPAPTLGYSSPKCKGGIDGSINLTFPNEDVSKYVFTINKLTKKENSSDPCGKNKSGVQLSEYEKNRDYCLTGESANVIPYGSNTIIIIDTSSLDKNDGLKGELNAGPYQLQIDSKNGISCIFDTLLDIPDASEVTLTSAAAKNSYSWSGDSKTYQIKGYGSTDTIETIIKDGYPPYRYSTDNGVTYSATTNETTKLISRIAAGDYYIKVLDSHNCRAKDDSVHIILNQPDTITVSGFVVDSVSCHVGNLADAGRHSDGNVQFSVKGGIGPYNITVEGEPTLGTSNNDGIVSLPGFSAKDYNIKVNDKYITDWDTSINVPSHSLLQFDPIADSEKYWPPCIGGNNGSLKVNGHGGKYFEEPEYKFGVIGVSDTIWADEDSITDLEALVSYKIVIKDQLSCHAVQNIIIPQNPNPLAIVLEDTIRPTCNDFENGSATFKGINGLSFADGYEFTLTNVKTHEDEDGRGTSHTFDGLKTGTYEIVIRDQHDCVINDYYRDTIFISEPLPLKIKPTKRPVTRKGANNGYLKTSVSGGNNKYNYEWYHGLSAIEDSLISSGTTDSVSFIEDKGVGDYLFRVKDIYGCNNGAGEDDWLEWETHISEPLEDLTFSVTEHKNVTCNGLSNGRLVIEGKGGWGNNYRYGLQPDKLKYDGEFNNLPAGLYTIYVADESEEVYHDIVEITEPDILQASVAKIIEPKCYKGDNGGFELAVVGGTQPYYVAVDNNDRTQGTRLNGLSANSYNVLVSDSFLCSTSVDVVITQPDSLMVNLINLSQTTCGNATGAISVNCSGGSPAYTYKWQNSDGKDYGTSANLQNLPVGAYRLSYTDTNNCNNLSPWYTISNSDGPLAADTIITPVTCYGYSDGKARIRVEKGIAPYTYKWSTGNETDSVSGLQSGDYFVTITDNLNCNNTLAIGIPTPQVLAVETISAVNPQCYNYSNGSIAIRGQGGTAPYNYNWNNGSGLDSINNLNAGSYTVTVKDANGCLANHSIELENPALLEIDLGTQTTICTGQVVTLDAGSFAGYLWTSDNGLSSNEQVVNLKEQGNYYLKVIDFNGCIAIDTFRIITSNTLLNADFIIKSEAFTGDTVVAVDISWPLPEKVYWEYDTKNISHFSEENYENLIFNKAGTYVITMYATLGECKDNFSHEIIIKPDSKFKSQTIENSEPLIKKFQVLPNPNNGRFKVEIELREITTAHLRLFNNARVINLRKIEGSSEQTVEYDIPGLTPGIYILHLIAGKEQKQLKIIIY